MQNPRIIFAGTPEFAHVSLVALVESGHVPIAVLTQPDRPAGRGKRITKSPVKRYAEARDIPVLQPESLRGDDIVAELSALRPDIMIIAAYGLLLPQSVLDITRHGCLNVHASVLPRWRGAAPIQAAIIADDETTGVSLMRMTAGLDCGPVYCDETLEVRKNETAGELHDRLAALGGELLVASLQDILDEKVAAIPQDEERVTYAGKIRNQDAEMDWTRPADELERCVRAYNPVPGAYFFAENTRVKCWSAEIVDGLSAIPGTVVQFDAGGIVIACGRDGLRLHSLQLPGKRRVQAHEFAARFDLRTKRLPG